MSAKPWAADGESPAPWTVDTAYDGIAIKDANGDIIAVCEDVARLIAASPDLYAALTYIAHGGESWTDCVRKARAALAHAAPSTGRG